MQNMKTEWQAESDYRSTDLTTHLRGVESLMRIAGGPEGLPQRQASALLMRHNVSVAPLHTHKPATFAAKV